MVVDEKVYTVNRRVQTIADALSDTGGLMGIIYSIAGLLLGSIQENLFFIKLISKSLKTSGFNETK